MASLPMDQLWRPLFDKYDCHKRGIISVANFFQIIEQIRLYKQNYLTVCGNCDDCNNNADRGNQLLAIPSVHRVVWSRISQKDGNNNKMINYEEFVQMIADLQDYNSPPMCCKTRVSVTLVDYITSSSLVENKAEHQSFVRRRLSRYCGLWRKAPFILGVTLLQWIIFLYYCQFHWNDWNKAISSSPLVYQLCARHQVWRLVSAVLMHGHFMHIIGNMPSQLYVGVSLELVHGWRRVAVIYFLGAIGGSLAHSLIPCRYTKMIGIGSSCAIYALFGAYFSNTTMVGLFILNRRHWCHFAGALTGFLIGPTVLGVPVGVTLSTGQVRLRWIKLFICVALFTFVIGCNVFPYYGSYYGLDRIVCVVHSKCVTNRP